MLQKPDKLWPDAAQQVKTQVRLLGASKFCSWASDNGSMVVCWASEISLNSPVRDKFQTKTISKLQDCKMS